jgi:hypothetical protein
MSMAAVRLREVRDAELAAGVALHHQTDDAFHGAPMFSALVKETVSSLTAHGVERGPARAAGHVAVELLIDGQLLRESAVGPAYLSALAAFGDSAPALATSDERALADLIERLTRYGIPYDYEQPEAVTARVSSVLARRRRLALDAAGGAVVGSIMPDLKARVVLLLPALLADLARGLSHPRYSETITG